MTSGTSSAPPRSPTSAVRSSSRTTRAIGKDTGNQVETFYSNRAFLDSEEGSIGTIPNPIRLHLFQITHTGVDDGSPATLKVAVLDAEAGLNMYLELTVDRRDSLADSGAAIAPVIGPLRAGNDLYVKINDSDAGDDPVVVGDVNVDVYCRTSSRRPTASAAAARAVPTSCYFRPDACAPPGP